MNLKELEAKFIAEHHAGEPAYVCYLLAEYEDGTVIFITTCDGHKTMLEAIGCHDNSAEKLSALETMNTELRKRFADRSICFVKGLHNIIVKETTTVEFLEA